LAKINVFIGYYKIVIMMNFSKNQIVKRPYRLYAKETGTLKHDGVYNPVTHILKAIEVFKRFGRGYKPRPASQ